ncbi:MAG TPA: hypothetical protein VK530_06060 [Candidatus Acidoferrum sp.]|nr:hypothetical protein [Candidatus Acidoferrum sp.]
MRTSFASRGVTRLLLVTSLALLSVSQAAELDYAQPLRLTGTVFARGTSNVLFRFERTAIQHSNTVRVLRTFTSPDGKLAARERVTFVNGKLSAFQLDQLQIGSQGNTLVTILPNGKHKLAFDYIAGGGGAPKKKTDNETAEGEVLVGDMIPYFLLSHWDELMRGQPAKFRFVAQSRLETIGFKLVKDGDLTWRGKRAVRIRMEPTSVIIAQIVDPLFFIVEKDGARRVLMYDGRTTPSIRQGSAWKDLDAVTIYDWD